MTGLYFKGFLKWWDARDWREVPCRILETELEAKHGSDSTTYQAMATYRYRYQGRDYLGDRVSFQVGSDNVGGFHRDAHRELKAHAENKEMSFRCFVNPDEPQESVLYRGLRWPMQAFMAVFALTFPAVGAGLVAGGLLGVRMKRREAELRLRHPREPWRWKADWADSTIPESSTLWNKALFAYTAWSGAITGSLVFTTWASGAFGSGRLPWLLLIFVAVWCVPAWFSLRRIRQRMMVGRARLELKTMPVWPGGRLEGVLLLDRPLPVRSTAEATLVCEKKMRTRNGKNTSVSTEKVWSGRDPVTQDEVRRGVAGFHLPLSIPVPADAPESEPDDGDGDWTWHEWKLKVEVAGLPVRVSFDVPVYRTADSPVAVDGGTPADAVLVEADQDLAAALAERRIRAEFDADGLPVSFVCPPARNIGMLVFLVLFNLVWTAAAVFLWKSDAPLIFKILWPVSATAIWLGVFWSLLHKRTATFDTTGVEVRNQLGPVVWTQVLEKSRIERFSHDSNMTSGNTRFFRVRLKSVTGKHKTLVDGITGSNTAKALENRLAKWKAG